MWPWRDTRPLGRQAEDLAARFLRRAGYRILAQNLRLGRYEVDIVARQGDTIAFVEVRSRRDPDPVAPENTVGYRKRRHLTHAAGLYMARHPDPDIYYRFDIVAIIFPEKGRPIITHLENAFSPEE
ncbi:MAG TPA: YraN family protein [Candidatus Hydrogenedentes bacterium]|nr:YraN family protein [Candidatus Hydrogenedentota bacterium]